jgi:cytochrome c biogenesis protein CcmG/thiol:disulfide interchange protein DsbE
MKAALSKRSGCLNFDVVLEALVPRLGAVLCLSALSACAGGGGASSASGNHPLVGNPAPDFSLPAQSGGKEASLASADGKVRLVDFWATWCGPCRASFPKYEALAKKYSSDVVIIGISEDDEADGIKDFAQQTGASFTLAWDKQKGVAASYHPESMPTSFIIDKKGLVRFVHAGFRDGDEGDIESELKGLLQ